MKIAYILCQKKTKSSFCIEAIGYICSIYNKMLADKIELYWKTKRIFLLKSVIEFTRGLQ